MGGAGSTGPCQTRGHIRVTEASFLLTGESCKYGFKKPTTLELLLWRRPGSEVPVHTCFPIRCLEVAVEMSTDVNVALCGW